VIALAQGGARRRERLLEFRFGGGARLADILALDDQCADLMGGPVSHTIRHQGTFANLLCSIFNRLIFLANARLTGALPGSSSSKMP